MKRTTFFLIAVMAVMLAVFGCGKKEPISSEQRNIWYDALDNLKNSTNYTVSLTTEDASGNLVAESHGKYAGPISMITLDDETVYYESDDGKCIGYGYDEESEFWINAEVEDSEYYFYAYTLVDRINKLSAYLDQGLLTYDEEDGSFSGQNLPGGYSCDDEVHKPTDLLVVIRNGRFVDLTESYILLPGEEDESDTTSSQIPKDSGVASSYNESEIRVDRISIGEYNVTEVRLPRNTISEDDLEKFGVIEETDEEDEEQA